MWNDKRRKLGCLLGSVVFATCHVDTRQNNVSTNPVSSHCYSQGQVMSIGKSRIRESVMSLWSVSD